LGEALVWLRKVEKEGTFKAEILVFEGVRKDQKYREQAIGGYKPGRILLKTSGF
jgi:hypothetical protein